MSKVVLDASALIAFLRREPGGNRVGEVLGRAVMSAVNLAEVLSRSLDRNAELDLVEAQLRVLPIAVVPFDREDAVAVARLRRSTRGVGLSLAGRCCLALGLRMGLPVLTTDKAWAQQDLGIRVELIR